MRYCKLVITYKDGRKVELPATAKMAVSLAVIHGRVINVQEVEIHYITETEYTRLLQN